MASNRPLSRWLTVVQAVDPRMGVVPAGAPMLKSARVREIQERVKVRESIRYLALLYRRAYIVSPSAGPKVLLMGRVKLSSKSNCQDLPLDRGDNSYLLLSW
ncbi:hypothetical protein L195_g012026 [Trifolium pratense]|uniref:Uncharacterized protein n=1 Tax=Trifolium pratense TaxID=57577 RepID=A0A2K3PJ68_TRIPR|nr:hypothetical protein L195_g012026 [Trifolium pratense]